MVYINVDKGSSYIILNCYKNSWNGEYFQLVIDPETKKLLKRPEKPDIYASIAYSRIFNLLEKGEELPDETVAAYG